MRKLTIGVASYRNPEKLRATLASIEAMSTTDWRCLIVHNPSAFASDEVAARNVISEFVNRNDRFQAIYMDQNVGYSGAVNVLFQHAATEYVAYCDNDIVINTRGWDEKLCLQLDMFHEIGLIFPNGGAYQIDRGNYQEVMWGVGFCWIMNRMAATDIQLVPGVPGSIMDVTLGHQEEADLCLRVRMAGWICAALPSVSVSHNATSSNDPASVERINRGVVNWVNKWCKYFCGKKVNYNSPNVLRWEDWPPNALYLEEYWKLCLPGMNKEPQVLNIDGRDYDLIQVLRFKDFYRGRII